MTVRVFIPKDDQSLPDSYKMTLHYVSGRREEFDVASHRIVEHLRIPNPEGKLFEEIEGQKVRFDVVPNPVPYYEFYDKEGCVHAVPVLSVQRVEFDKAYSKFLEAGQKFYKRKGEAA